MPPNVNQKYDKCSVWSVPEIYPGYCLNNNYTNIQCEQIIANKAALTGTVPHGRGTPEIDLLEVSVSDAGEASLSTSLQIGPLTGENGWVNGSGKCHDLVSNGISTGTGGDVIQDETVVNPYHGNYGVEIMSGLSKLKEAMYEVQHVYRVEWLMNETLAWYIKRQGDGEHQRILTTTLTPLTLTNMTLTLTLTHQR